MTNRNREHVAAVWWLAVESWRHRQRLVAVRQNPEFKMPIVSGGFGLGIKPALQLLWQGAANLLLVRKDDVVLVA